MFYFQQNHSGRYIYAILAPQYSCGLAGRGLSGLFPECRSGAAAGTISMDPAANNITRKGMNFFIRIRVISNELKTSLHLPKDQRCIIGH